MIKYYSSKIIGLGKYLPENKVTNDDLSTLMDTSHDWIVERTGIEERRFIAKDSAEGTASMGVWLPNRQSIVLGLAKITST